MHLITQTAHVLPCRNSAMKGNNGTNRIPRYYCRNQHRTSPWCTVGTRLSGLYVSLCVLQTWTLPDAGNRGKNDWSDHMKRFPVAWCPGFVVVTPSFTHLSITFSNQRFSNCSPTVDVRFVKLTSASFCGNRVFKMNIQFWCHLCCSSSVILSSIYDNLFLSILIFGHCSCWLMLSSHDSCTPI
jgi:hypothetical protein